MDSLITVCSKRETNFSIYILLDYLRATRNDSLESSISNNSISILLPLVQKFPKKVTISLFHTPLLRGLLKKV